MMGGGACPYCPGTERRRRSARTAAGLWVRECCDCGRVVEEMQAQAQDHFYVRAQDTPLCLVTPDLLFPEEMTMMLQPPADDDDDDPFEPTGFITAFSTWSLEPVPVAARSSFSFCGLLAELERSLLLDSPLNNSSSSSSNPTMSTSAATPLHASSSSAFLVDNLRAHLQILEVGSILKLDWEILGHAFQLFRDCSSVTCLRNRNVEALATAALLQAIREAQEPRTLQEISTASNLPQKEIGKYIKILGEALKLSQPINSNSISVHMPRFCKLLQLNQSARDIATHIGEVVVNKCFCTRRNPISISAAAIYLACQLEDKRKTQAEICKVTGLTEVTLRKVYKELLENWDDLLPPNYTPAVPPEKAFPMTCITSCRILTPKVEPVDVFSSPNVQEIRSKHTDVNKPNKEPQLSQMDCLVGQKEDLSTSIGANSAILNVDAEALIHNSELWKPQTSSELPNFRSEKTDWRIDINQTLLDIIELDEGRDQKDNSTLIEKSCSGPSSSTIGGSWPLSGRPSYDHFLQHHVGPTSIARPPWIGNSNKWELLNPCDNSKERNDIDDIN